MHDESMDVAFIAFDRVSHLPFQDQVNTAHYILARAYAQQEVLKNQEKAKEQLTENVERWLKPVEA